MRMGLLITVLLLCVGRPLFAVKVADITRLSGEHTNVLTGLGLVVGLRGTGDGGQFGPAVRPLAAMLAKFNDKADPRELVNVKNVALVQVTVVVPARGAQRGDRLDVHVMSVGSAASLRGGRLIVTPLVGPTGPTPDEEIFGLAQGAIVIEDATPTHAVIPRGAVLEMDFIPPVIEKGRLQLILAEPAASWTTASTIAKIINDAEGTGGETLAIALSASLVQVVIPAIERDNPASFISRVQRLPVPLLPTEAKVIINEKTGTIIMTGDVEISPVVISHKGLTITTINPPPQPTPRTPVTTERRTVGLDTTQQGGAKLQELVDAMDMIRVPAEDRITIVKELYKTGKLHAQLVMTQNP